MALFLLAALLLVAVGCTSDDTTTTTVSGGTSTTGGAGPAAGGDLRVGMAAPTNLDPAFSTSQADILLNQQLYDYLVAIDDKNQVAPALATSWQPSEDGLTWTFDMNSGVTFSNGDALTAEDVVYTFDRLRDPEVGAPTVSLYEQIKEVTAPSDTQVQFVLSAPNPDFPADAADYHAAILSKDVADPKAEQVGSGPFRLDSFEAENRAMLVKNPDYWMKDSQGSPLPYLDSIEFVFGPDQGAQVQSLISGELDFVPGLTAELAEQVKAESSLTLLENISNMHWVIHMRADEGRPAADVRVRQALRLATDHQAMIDAVRPGLAEVGNGTPVGPLYGDIYLDQPPALDLEKARQLLADAGKSDLTITLVAQDSGDVPAIATVWKEQMAQIGVTVNIQTVPPDVYYGDGDQSWLKVDFGITDWGTRATPVQYFQNAYVTGASSNETHWSNPEFDRVVQQIATEMDEAARVELYQQAQRILIDAGPVIVPYMVKPVAGANAKVEGLTLAPDWPRTPFLTARLAG